MSKTDQIIDNSRFQSLVQPLPKGRGKRTITVGVDKAKVSTIGVDMPGSKLTPEDARWVGEALLKAYSFAKELDDPVIAWRMDVDDHPDA